MEGTMAVVTCFAADFAPKNWAYCNGQILAISTNTALFSLLGTTYGGNGVNTFALPDLRGRTQISPGNGAGLPSYALGQTDGTETVSLNLSNLPAHAHNGPISLKLQADNTNADQTAPDFNYPSLCAGQYGTSGNNASMSAPTVKTVTVGASGNSIPVQILDPYLVVNYVICQYGIFPSRN